MRQKNNSRSIMLICVLVALVCLSSCHTRGWLENKITDNLENWYGVEFEMESMRIDGGGVSFVCYPKSDPTLLFDGFGDSKTGGISYERLIGAVFARDDTRIMTESLTANLGDVYVYATPRFISCTNAVKVIRSGDFTPENIRECAGSTNLFIYIFINVSSELYIDDPGRDYDMISESVDTLVDYYMKMYEVSVCVDMHIYYVTDDEMEYAKKFYLNHTEVDYEFQNVITPQHRITLQMGPEDAGSYADTLRLSRDEYIEKREGMK